MIDILHELDVFEGQYDSFLSFGHMLFGAWPYKVLFKFKLFK